MSCLGCGGKLFHTRGSAALKLQSPKLLCVRRTMHVLTAAERIADGDQCPSQVGCRQLGMPASDPLATGATETAPA